MIAAIVVRLAFLDRQIALPVAFCLVRKGTDDASRLHAARRLVEALTVALPARRINVVADSAYAGKALRGLPAEVTWTTRLRSNAALYELAPPPTGRRGRPKTKGAKLASLAQLAAQTAFTPTPVTRYGLTATVQTAVISCLWYGVFGPQQVQVILVRDKANAGYNIALVSTRARCIPRQLWMPPAKEMCARRGRCMSNTFGFSHRLSSRLAEPMHKLTCAPSGIVMPCIFTSRVVLRATRTNGVSYRMPSSIAAGMRSRFR